MEILFDKKYDVFNIKFEMNLQNWCKI